MLESFNSNKTFEYEKLTEEECKKRGILGRLKGIIADSKNPTRNERYYSKKLWENVFSNPIMQEKIKNRCVFGELCHPADRTEIDMEKIAVCLSEQPKISDDGKVWGIFDIIDTPNGRILKTLCDYGTTVGISSRGTGDVFTNDDGQEEVDPDTYDCECFDIVIVPAVETARLQYVTESLDNKPTLKQALVESLNNSTEEQRKVMLETLQELNIDINTSDSDNIPTETSNDTSEKINEAIDDGTEKLMKSLQEAILEKSKLENEVKNLHNLLAVSDTKVEELTEEVERYKSSTKRLTEMYQAKPDNSERISLLEEEVKTKEKTIKVLKERCQKLISKSKETAKTNTSINESLNTKDNEIKKLNESINSIEKNYKDKLNEAITLKESVEKKLNEEITILKEKLNKQTKLTQSHIKLTEEVVDRYIKSKAVMLGVSSQEIKNRLNDEYTLDDIDTICEDLQNYTLSLSRLPFRVDGNTRVKITESKNIKSIHEDDADDVDDSLIRLAKLK